MRDALIAFTLLVSSVAFAQTGQSLIDEEEWFLVRENNIMLYVHEFGKGEPVIVLHGGYGQEHGYLMDLLVPLQEDYRFVLFDQRGALRSPVPDSLYTKAITMENYITDLDDLRKEITDGPVKLLGHSMGAHYAYSYLQKHPDSVKELVIISGFLPKWPDREEMQIMMGQQKQRSSFMANRPVEKYKKELAEDRSLGKSKRGALEWKLQYAAGQIYDLSNWKKVRGGGTLFNPRLNALLSPERTGKEFSFLENLKNHPYPVHYIFGYHEFGDYGLTLHKRWLSDMPNVTMNILEEAAHTVWLDKPEEVKGMIRKAFGKH